MKLQQNVWHISKHSVKAAVRPSTDIGDYKRSVNNQQSTWHNIQSLNEAGVQEMNEKVVSFEQKNEMTRMIF